MLFLEEIMLLSFFIFVLNVLRIASFCEFNARMKVASISKAVCLDVIVAQSKSNFNNDNNADSNVYL